MRRIEVDDASYDSILEKLDKYALMNKQLRQANTALQKENKHLRRVIKKKNDEAAKERKPHYKNGQKRGANGRNG